MSIISGSPTWIIYWWGFSDPSPLPGRPSVQFSSVTQSCLTHCDLKNRSMPALSRVFSNTTVQKHQLLCSAFFTAQFSHTRMTTGKTIALIRHTFVGKVMSLLFNMLSRLVITFLPRSKHLLISWPQSPFAVILEPPKNNVWHCLNCFPVYLPWSDGTRCHDLSFLNVEF